MEAMKVTGQFRFQNFCNKVSEELPEGYILKLCIENGAAWVELEDSEVRNILDHDVLDGISMLMDQIVEVVRIAKEERS